MTAVTLLPTHWTYCSFALTHGYAVEEFRLITKIRNAICYQLATSKRRLFPPKNLGPLFDVASHAIMSGVVYTSLVTGSPDVATRSDLCGGPLMTWPFISFSIADRLLHVPSPVAIWLSVGYETWLPIGWRCPFYDLYMLMYRQTSYISRTKSQKLKCFPSRLADAFAQSIDATGC